MIGNLWCWTRECARRILRSPMCPWVYPHYLKGKGYVHFIMSLLTFQAQGYRVKKRNWKADSILAVRRGGRQLPNAGPKERSSMLLLQIRDGDAVLRGNKDIKTDLLSVSKKERQREREIYLGLYAAFQGNLTVLSKNSTSHTWREDQQRESYQVNVQ